MATQHSAQTVQLPTRGLGKIVVAIASNNWQDDNAGSHFHCARERAAVRRLIASGVMEQRRAGAPRGEFYAGLTNAAAEALGLHGRYEPKQVGPEYDGLELGY